MAFKILNKEHLCKKLKKIMLINVETSNHNGRIPRRIQQPIGAPVLSLDDEGGPFRNPKNTEGQSRDVPNLDTAHNKHVCQVRFIFRFIFTYSDGKR